MEAPCALGIVDENVKSIAAEMLSDAVLYLVTIHYSIY